MYGSGVSSDPVHEGTTASSSTPGSHLDKSHATGHDPLSTSANPTSTSGYGSTTSGTGHHSAVNEQPFSSHGLGTTGLNEPSSTTGRSGTLDDAATTASIKSGIPGAAQSGSHTTSSGTYDTLDTNKPLPHKPTGTELSGQSSSTATAGPHSSNLANRADPRIDSDLDGSRGLGAGTTGSGSGLTGSSLPVRSAGR